MKEAQEKKLEELKRQQEIHNRLALERILFLRDRKIKFFGKDQPYQDLLVCVLVQISYSWWCTQCDELL